VFAAGTLAASLLTLAAGGTVLPLVWRVPGRRRIAGLAGLGAVVGLLVLSIASEVGGSHLPVSGLWLAGFSAVVYGVTFRWMRPPGPRRPGEVWAQGLGLSPREQEVLTELMRTSDRVAVAESLFISPVTVKNHLASLYRRTGVSDLASLRNLARSHGWGEPDQGP